MWESEHTVDEHKLEYKFLKTDQISAIELGVQDQRDS